MNFSRIALLVVICISLFGSCIVGAALDDFTSVTYGSIIKLTNIKEGAKLHSHNVPYGTGSHQQSVTGFPENDDPNSFWLVIQSFGEDPVPDGTIVSCGDTIRLQHHTSRRYLHSHLHQSPLTRQQEVSAYEGQDTGDNWKLICSKGEAWERDADVRFVHVDTGLYLRMNRRTYHEPPGQKEVTCHKSKSKEAIWAAQEGIYFPRI